TSKLRGFPEEDKKYLRVHYEVLERSTREKFKYEEQHIDLLRAIRKDLSRRVPKPPGPIPQPPGPIPQPPGPVPPQPQPPADADPYVPMLEHLQLSREMFDRWRGNFARHADSLGRDVAQILNMYRKVGTFESPEVSASGLAAAFRNPCPPFDKESFVRFTG